jgi:hypothetical protein
MMNARSPPAGPSLTWVSIAPARASWWCLQSHSTPHEADALLVDIALAVAEDGLDLADQRHVLVIQVGGEVVSDELKSEDALTDLFPATI